MILGRERKFYQFSGLTRQSCFVTGRYKFIKLSGMCIHMENLTDYLMGSIEDCCIPLNCIHYIDMSSLNKRRQNLASFSIWFPRAYSTHEFKKWWDCNVTIFSNVDEMKVYCFEYPTSPFSKISWISHLRHNSRFSTGIFLIVFPLY